MSSFESVGARLSVEHSTVAAFQLLERSAIESVVLRGPCLARRLYERSEVRVSTDVDLLVEDIDACSALLRRHGYSRVVDWTPGMSRHAWTHVKENEVSIDLHRSLVGVEAPPDVAWKVFSRESEEAPLGGGRVRAPRLAAHLLIVALHAAQHGAGDPKTTEDLSRALDRFDGSEWLHAAEIAAELSAIGAFAAGLSIVGPGRELGASIALPALVSRSTLVRAGGAPPTALGLSQLAQLHGRERWRYVGGKILPPRAFMESWHPLARHGWAGLVAAYAYRAIRLARWLPSGVRSVRNAKKEDLASPNQPLRP
jgi:hypothetical protein